MSEALFQQVAPLLRADMHRGLKALRTEGRALAALEVMHKARLGIQEAPLQTLTDKVVAVLRPRAGEIVHMLHVRDELQERYPGEHEAIRKGIYSSFHVLVRNQFLERINNGLRHRFLVRTPTN